MVLDILKHLTKIFCFYIFYKINDFHLNLDFGGSIPPKNSSYFVKPLLIKSNLNIKFSIYNI